MSPDEIRQAIYDKRGIVTSHTSGVGCACAMWRLRSNPTNVGLNRGDRR